MSIRALAAITAAVVFLGLSASASACEICDLAKYGFSREDRDLVAKKGGKALARRMISEMQMSGTVWDSRTNSFKTVTGSQLPGILKGIPSSSFAQEASYNPAPAPPRGTAANGAAPKLKVVPMSQAYQFSDEEVHIPSTH